MYQNCPYITSYPVYSYNSIYQNQHDKMRHINSISISNRAPEIAKAIGIDFETVKFDINQFKMGLEVELEHGYHNPLTNTTNDDPVVTGKIALAHLNEFPDYYTRLAILEKEAKEYWKTR